MARVNFQSTLGRPRWRSLRMPATVLAQLFPAEQVRIVRLLVERVDLAPTGLRVKLRAEGLQTLDAELRMRTAA